jgi:hypothetical protein
LNGGLNDESAKSLPFLLLILYACICISLTLTSFLLHISVCRKLQNPWRYFFFLIRTPPHQNPFKLRLTPPKSLKLRPATMTPQKGRHFESYDHLYDPWMRCWIDESLFPSDPSLFEMRTHRFIEMRTHRFIEMRTHRFLKWEPIAFSNENPSLFEMRTHRFFSLTHLDHHTTPYNTYDHRWVPISHTPDDMQGNFLICMKTDQKTVFEFFHTDGKISLNVIRCMRNRHSTMIVCIIKSDVMIEMSQRKKAMGPHFKKRWVSIWKSDESSFEKAISPYLKKRWVPIWKSDGSPFEKAMGPHLKKRWVPIWKSDGSSFQKAMSPHFKKRWVPISKSDGSPCQFELTTTLRSHDSRSQFEWFWWGETQFEWVLIKWGAIWMSFDGMRYESKKTRKPDRPISGKA